MTLRQFEYLVTVVDEGSFTRAAELLHVTQPALSHQIRALERSVGTPLLDRLPRAVRLTPAGRAWLPFARSALADAERAATAARRVGGLECGELAVATVYSLTLGALPPVLRKWRALHPDVRIRLFEHRHADELREAMTRGQADVAVGPRPVEWSGYCHYLGGEEFVLVLPPGTAHDGPVDLRSFADQGWVLPAPGNGLADFVDAACRERGFQPWAAVRTEQTASVPVLAAAGLGPALVPRNVLPETFDGVVVRPDPPVRRELAAFGPKEPDPLTSAFIGLLEQAGWDA
ncbi:LysR family transcriptional regulator [Actinosynnema sp. NPDC047251]|uniref:Transcriptional regulator, LysR family n=1 Tax=Saccharothrix espanaensis (strain ATCC 51144 / DSM 44229 / JCM 9112 / NBRC 15066 / NRRL 15764) TaxID=1179773 RepID=K0JW81_SACES|nr:LysR family transcriptional regulator [Saccharothrix espanaensis]CCH29049.1 Transcriptional regulator, LysR family [Saccharothrix espanaensis DSM 44229]